MGYIINPIPDMEYQRLLGGIIPGLIDPTCGRYCLKSLLKYWHEKRGQRRATRINIVPPESGWGDWVAYDAYNDYPHAKDILVRSGYKPGSPNAWEEHLVNLQGPIILAGKGLGDAASFVGHYILLVGVFPETPNATFHYLDPLVGAQVQTAPFEPMQTNIRRCLVYAKGDICDTLSRSDRYFTVAA